MGLVAAELERQGIVTVAIQLLRSVAEHVRPPRALFVPFPHGYPLDAPGELGRQHEVIEAALGLLEHRDSPVPVLADFEPNSARNRTEGGTTARRAHRGGAGEVRLDCVPPSQEIP